MKKDNIVKGIIKAVPIILIIFVILIGLYMHSLIIQDTITAEQAEFNGYIALGFIIALLVIAIIMNSIGEQEKIELEYKINIQDKKIEELEAELERIKKD